VAEPAVTWSRLEALLEQALRLPPSARPALLARIADTDRALRLELDSLLAVEDRACALAVERVIDDAPDARLGTTLGPWRLVAVLGRGGMGSVYRVERADGLYDQQAALKLAGSSPLDSLGMERFRTERQVL
jgi:hypothetical protein